MLVNLSNYNPTPCYIMLLLDLLVLARICFDCIGQVHFNREPHMIVVRLNSLTPDELMMEKNLDTF